MYQNLTVIYEDGVLKPLEKPNLKEHQKVDIIILPDESETAKLVESQKKALSKFCGIGSSGIGDIGRNHDKYLYRKEE